MFRIKICGVTRVEDVRQIVQAGADAIGLNFYPASPRSIDLDEASRIVCEIPAGIDRVGVFVNASEATIRRAHNRLSLDAIQLHGDEPPHTVSQLHDLPVIRAFRCRDEPFTAIRDYLDQCGQLGVLPKAVLIDAYSAQAYGGTGETVAWQRLADTRDQFGDVPLVLAGGLSPVNVGSAITLVRPQAVDTASGVEASPGTKDARLVDQFVVQARAAFARVDSDRPSGP
ncbi:MAG: phosphoribosylanthranilate isomerase [Pirellulales bacterium]